MVLAPRRSPPGPGHRRTRAPPARPRGLLGVFLVLAEFVGFAGGLFRLVLVGLLVLVLIQGLLGLIRLRPCGSACLAPAATGLAAVPVGPCSGPASSSSRAGAAPQPANGFPSPPAYRLASPAYRLSSPANGVAHLVTDVGYGGLRVAQCLGAVVQAVAQRLDPAAHRSDGRGLARVEQFAPDSRDDVSDLLSHLRTERADEVSSRGTWPLAA